MPVPYTFGTATAAIPLSQLDSNFATAVTIGNTAVQLGNTVTTLNNLTLANVTISSGNVTITNVSVTTANVSGTANVSSLVVLTNETVLGNTTVTGNVSTTNLTLTGGTANGVGYLNGSKVLTTGSALTFDGTNLSATGSISTTISSKTAQFNAVGGSIYAQFADGTNTWRLGTGIQAAGQFNLYDVTNAQTALTFSPGASGYTAFLTNNTERMRIDSSGNVGIGTNSPSFGLSVQKDNGSGYIALFRKSVTDPALTIQTTSSITQIQGLNAALSAVNDIAMQISGGNVGIGTTSFSQKLFVQNTDTTAWTPDTSIPQIQAYNSTATNNATALYGASVNYGDGTYTGVKFGAVATSAYSAAMVFATRSAGTFYERMRIDSSGNVGIGTNSPNYKLNVLAGSGSQSIFQAGQTGVSNGYTITSNGTNLTHQWYNGGSEAARIDSSGNVGIGTSSPNASAILDAQSTTKGVRFPNMTTTQKNAISSPPAGLVVFDTTLSKLCVYSGAAWQTITSV